MLYNLDKIYSQNELDLIFKSFEKPKNICIFVNKIKTNNKYLENKFINLGLKFDKINDFCYIFPSDFKQILSKMREFNDGFFYIQNYASFLCAKNLNAKSGEIVLDMCAAPGGKSVNLANFMQNQGYLACVEKSKDRFHILHSNLEKYGVLIAKCFLKDAKVLGKICPNKFDKILLDAPCSTLAKIGFESEKNIKEIKKISLLNKKLLNSALNALKPGGELVYSTCTFTREENEEVLENALKSKFKLKFLPLDLENADFKQTLSEFDELKNAKRILPCENYDGFFIAKMQKIE